MPQTSSQDTVDPLDEVNDARLTRALSLRTKALALLQEATSLDALKPYLVTFVNDEGPIASVVWSATEPTIEQAKLLLDFDYVDAGGKHLDVDPTVSMEALTGVWLNARMQDVLAAQGKSGEDLETVRLYRGQGTVTTVPTGRLRDSLLSMGWTMINASDARAYIRHGARYLTWRKGPVTIASTATSKVYSAERGVVEQFYGDGVHATIEALVVDDASRGAGAARAALQEWVDAAVEAGVILFIEPEPQEPGVSADRLVAFYRSMGFLPADRLNRVMIKAILEP